MQRDAYERSAVFIDGAYLRKLSQNAFQGARFDFRKMTDVMTETTRLFRAFYYDCPPYKSDPPTEDEIAAARGFDSFRRSLEALERFHVRLGKLARVGQGHDGRPMLVQKRVDLMLGMDMVDLAVSGMVDVVILLAGDSDFLPAIEKVKSRNVLTYLWHGPRGLPPHNTVHDDLWFACDERFEITQDIMEEVRRSPGPSYASGVI